MALSLKRRFWLWSEMALLFIGAPLAMAFLMPPQMIYLTLISLLVIGST